MPSVKINSKKFDLNEVLVGISNLSIDELRQVMSQVGTFIARKKVSHYTNEETKLINKIQEGLPDDLEKRYQELQIKMLQETITSEEHQEALKLLEMVEEKANERLKYIIELSILWNISTDEVMQQLELKPPPPIHA